MALGSEPTHPMTSDCSRPWGHRHRLASQVLCLWRRSSKAPSSSQAASLREPGTAECGARGGGRGPGGGRAMGADLSGILMPRRYISAWKVCTSWQSGHRKWCRAACRAWPWGRGTSAGGPHALPQGWG